MNQTNHFFNLGYGWLCKHCSAENTEHQQDQHGPGRFSQADNTAGAEPRVSGLALASWTDVTRHSLTCPRCGIEEVVNKA